MTALSAMKKRTGGSESSEKHQVLECRKIKLATTEIFTFEDGSVHFVENIIYGFSIDGDERRKQL